MLSENHGYERLVAELCATRFPLPYVYIISGLWAKYNIQIAQTFNYFFVQNADPSILRSLAADDARAGSVRTCF